MFSLICGSQAKQNKTPKVMKAKGELLCMWEGKEKGEDKKEYTGCEHAQSTLYL
jgi:hypothetical protein